MKNKKIMYGTIIGVVALVVILIAVQSSARGSDIIQPTHSSASDSTASVSDGTIHEYDYTDAPDHIGEKATVKGTVLKVFTAKSGVTFLDYCTASKDCPFSAVIFAGDAKKFGDLSKLQGNISITGVIKSYQGKVEMVLNDPTQLNK